MTSKTPNLITVNIGGLLDQLKTMEEGLSSLRSRFELSSKESESQFKEFVQSEQIKFEKIQQDVTMLTAESKQAGSYSSSTKQTQNNLIYQLGELNQKFVQLDEDLKTISQTQQRQETDQINQNQEQNRKFQSILKDFQEQKTKVNDQISMFSLSTNQELELAKDKLATGLTTIETLQTQLTNTDNFLQQILDRVESIELLVKESDKNRDESAGDQDIVSSALVQSNTLQEKTDRLQTDEQKEVCRYIRMIIEESKAKTIEEVFELTLSFFEMAKRQLSKLSKGSKVTQSQESGGWTQQQPEYQQEQKQTEGSVLKILEGHESTLKDISSHLPSLIQQVIEDHVRQVGDHLVFLEYLQPKWLQDGRLQIGSNYAQVFAHLEVQTYQQEQLLKKQTDENLLILELQNQIEGMKDEMKKQEKKISLIEEGKDIDFSQLAVDNAGLKELHGVMKDLKSELLLRSVTKDEFQRIEREIIDLKQQGGSNPITGLQTAYSEEIQASIDQMQQFPSQLQSLQVQIMKNETLCFDVERLCSSLNRRMGQFEDAAAEHIKDVEAIGKQFDDDYVKRMKLVAAIKFFVTSTCVTQNQFAQLNNQIVQGFQKIDNQSLQTQICQIKISEQSKNFRNIDSQLKSIQLSQATLKLNTERVVAQMNDKVSLDVLNEETYSIKQMIFNSAPKGRSGSTAQNSLAAQLSQQKAGAVGGGGMTTAQKNQLKELVENVERHERSIRMLQTMVRNFNTEELKSSLAQLQKQISNFATRVQVENLNLELQGDNILIKSQMKSQNDELNQAINRYDDRMQKMSQKNGECDEHLQRVLNTVQRVEESIVAMKRGNAAGALRQKLMTQVTQSALSVGLSGDKSEGDNVDGFRDEFEQFKTTLTNRLDVTDKNIKKLLPLIEGNTEVNVSNEKKVKASGGVGKKSDIETRITERLMNINSQQHEEIQKLKSQIEELKKVFDEKIRRQQLILDHKRKGSGDEEVIKTLKKRQPQFLAQQFQRDLVLTGKLPQHQNIGENIARLGKGFSQILSSLQGHQLDEMSPRLLHEVSIGELADVQSTEYLLQSPRDHHSTQHSLRHLIQKSPSNIDNLEGSSRERPNARDKEMSHEHRQLYLQSQRLQGIPRANIFKTKKQSAGRRQSNVTSLVIEDVHELGQLNENWQNTYRLPMIYTSRSINESKVLLNETM